jgi:hypothetical protein
VTAAKTIIDRAHTICNRWHALTHYEGRGRRAERARHALGSTLRVCHPPVERRAAVSGRNANCQRSCSGRRFRRPCRRISKRNRPAHHLIMFSALAHADEPVIRVEILGDFSIFSPVFSTLAHLLIDFQSNALVFDQSATFSSAASSSARSHTPGARFRTQAALCKWRHGVERASSLLVILITAVVARRVSEGARFYAARDSDRGKNPDTPVMDDVPCP